MMNILKEKETAIKAIDFEISKYWINCAQQQNFKFDRIDQLNLQLDNIVSQINLIQNALRCDNSPDSVKYLKIIYHLPDDQDPEIFLISQLMDIGEKKGEIDRIQKGNK